MMTRSDTTFAGEGPILLRIEDVANLLQIGRTKCFEMLAAGELPSPIRLGKNIRISRTALELWVELRQAEAEAAP